MFFVLLKKELFIELRSKELILSMVVFGIAIVLAFSFSSNLSRTVVMDYASGMFWITVLFVSALGVHRSFAYEKEYDAFSMLVTAPIDRGLIFLAKWVSGFIYLTLMEILIIFPFFKFLMIEYPPNILIAISTTLFVNLAIMAVANLVSGIAMRSNLSEILLPILFFPLVSPIIIAATKISTSVMLNDSYVIWEIWVLIVGSIIIISGLAGYALFDYLVEE